MADRKQLIGLIERFCGGLMVSDIQPPYGFENLADYLISNGVEIPVQCKDCDWARDDLICVNPKCTKSFYGCPVPPEHYCSYGRPKEE